MEKIYSLAAAIVFIAVSLAGAGNFEVLGDAGVVSVPTPIYIKPGTVVKADFRSNLKTTSDTELGSYPVTPEKVSSVNDGTSVMKPAITYRERSAKGMAPPPRVNPSSEATLGSMAELQDSASDLEADLEKDLVLSPPSSKSTEVKDAGGALENSKKQATERPAVSDKKNDVKKKASPVVRRVAPSAYEKHASSSKPVRKVRPVTNDSWFFPAGSHQTRALRVNPEAMMSPPRQQDVYRNVPSVDQAQRGHYYSTRGVTPPPTSDRFVRDGVTIKLAPASVGAERPQFEDDSSASDIFSTAAEIIGLPFALISSFF